MTPRSSVPLSPSQPLTVVDHIWLQLRALILRGELAPGTRIFELDVAEKTSSSQVAVREALQRLERDDLVVRRGRQGTFVTEVRPDEMEEVFRVRLTVEIAAIERVIDVITAEQIAELREIVARMRKAGSDGDIVAVVESDLDLHERICELADHPTLLRVWAVLRSQMERYLVIYDATYFADLRLVADIHRPVVEALEQGDRAGAVLQMQKHLAHMPSLPPPAEQVAATGRAGGGYGSTPPSSG